MPTRCLNKPDNFCYICGQITFAQQKHKITSLIEKAYYLYFGCKIGDQDKSWAPHICYNTCASNLQQWFCKKRKAKPFGIPMVWREQADHMNDCYFCLVLPVKELSRKKRHSIIYPHISLARRPVPHEIGICIPEVPKLFSLDFDESKETSASEMTDSSLSTESHFGESSSQELHLII